MASAIILGNSNTSGWKGRLWWEAYSNASANTSTLTMTMQVYRTLPSGDTTSNSSKYTGWMYYTYGDVIEEVDFSDVSVIVPANTWTTIKTKTYIVDHDSNGKRSVEIVGGFHNTWGLELSFEGTAVFDTITRTKATVTSAPNFKDTENPTITYSNPMGNNATSLEACIANSTGYTIYAGYRSISKTGSSYTFNLTTAERNTLIAAAGNSTTLTVRFYIRTGYGGSTYLSYLTKTMTLDVSGPSITASIVDVKADTTALTGAGTRFVRGNNSMQYSMTATGEKGATISSYSVVCGNMKSSSASGTFTNIENEVVIFSATDSRGLTSTKTITLTPIDYVKLTCNQEVRMIVDGGTSAQINVSMSGNFFNGSFGAKSNTLKLYVRHARNGAALGDWVDLSALLYETSGNTYTFSTDISGFDPSGTYTFQCKAVDGLSTATTGTYAVQFVPIFDWSSDDFNFNVPVQMNGQTVLRHNSSANNLVVSASGGFIYFRPAGTSNTSNEVKINPQGNIELSGDIIINGQSLKSLLGIS